MFVSFWLSTLLPGPLWIIKSKDQLNEQTKSNSVYFIPPLMYNHIFNEEFSFILYNLVGPSRTIIESIAIEWWRMQKLKEGEINQDNFC